MPANGPSAIRSTRKRGRRAGVEAHFDKVCSYLGKASRVIGGTAKGMFVEPTVIEVAATPARRARRSSAPSCR
jgi:hypothetical protein